MHVMDGLQLCTYIVVFLCGIRWHRSKLPNSGPHFLVIFYQFDE